MFLFLNIHLIDVHQLLIKSGFFEYVESIV